MGGPEGVAWFPSRLGLVGSLAHCVPTLVGNPLLWDLFPQDAITQWDAVIFTAMLGSPPAAWHHPTPDHQPQRLLAQPDGTDPATSVGMEPPLLWHPGPRSWGC